MTYWTIAINGGPEKTLADWNITACTREVANLSKDGVDITLQAPVDSVDPFPYGTKITLYRGRSAAGGPQTNSAAAASGLPGSGFTAFSGGVVFFIGYSIHNRRRASAQEESFNHHFAGPWEFFLERTILKQLFFSYNGAANVAGWRSQFVLGLSLNTLYGTEDTVEGSTSTNLMTIKQVVIQIVQYCIAQTANLTQYGSTAQFQFDTLSSDGSNTSYNLDARTLEELVAAGAKCLIPDFVPGFEETGQTNQDLPTSNVSGATFSVALRAPLTTVNDMMCAEALRYQLKWLVGFVGSVGVWFDYTTTPPTLHIGTRDILAASGAINLPFPAPGAAPLVGPQGQSFTAAASDIDRKDDLIPACTAIIFRIVQTTNGFQSDMIINDIAMVVTADMAEADDTLTVGEIVEGIGLDGKLCTPASFLTEDQVLLASPTQTALVNAANAPGGKSATIDMEGYSVSAQYCNLNAIPFSSADPASDDDALDMWQFLCPELENATGLTLSSGSSVTAVDDNGHAIDTTEYAYILQDSAIPAWLNPGGDPITVQATIVGDLQYQEVATLPSGTPPPTKLKSHHEKSPHCTLCRLAGGSYEQAGIQASEVVPFGLAGYIQSIESIPQYEGSYTIQETEITDMVPVGSCLNLTGSANPQWTTMNALVQSVLYDIAAGRSVVRFGPAAHLGAKDMVELNRANRGPRLLYLIGANLANQPNSAGGNTSIVSNAQRASNQGTEQNSVAINHLNLADSQTYASDYTQGYPGWTLDLRTSGQPTYGGISPAPTGPTLVLQGGSGGEYDGCVRLSETDTGGVVCWIQEYPICFDFDDDAGPVECFVKLFGCPPYHTSGDPDGG